MVRRGTPDPVASALAETRRRQQLTLVDLSERMYGTDTARTRLSMYERGLCSPTLTTLRRWAEALGLDLVLVGAGDIADLPHPDVRCTA